MAEMSVTISDTLEILLNQKKYNAIKTVLSTMNPSDIAALLESVPAGNCCFCSGFCQRSLPRTPLWKWTARRKNHSFRASPIQS